MTRTPPLLIGLNAVLTALEDTQPLVLCVARDGAQGLPFGSFDPNQHRTLELGMRDFVEHQTAVPLGYVEQLYTFGDMGRERPKPSISGKDASSRIISIGYLGLAPKAETTARKDVHWQSWYTFFPWEDWRDGMPACLNASIFPALHKWASSDDTRLVRVRANFGLDDIPWEEERALDRYELMYEAELVGEAMRDRNDDPAKALPDTGDMMISDHRRILATAIGRLRGKLRYRPVIFQMLGVHFTLTELQTAVETILGFTVHKQNFRRSVESAQLVLKTTTQNAGTGGRPAALYQASPLAKEKHAPGLTLPRRR